MQIDAAAYGLEHSDVYSPDYSSLPVKTITVREHGKNVIYTKPRNLCELLDDMYEVLGDEDFHRKKLLFCEVHNRLWYRERLNFYRFIKENSEGRIQNLLEEVFRLIGLKVKILSGSNGDFEVELLEKDIEIIIGEVVRKYGISPRVTEEVINKYLFDEEGLIKTKKKIIIERMISVLNEMTIEKTRLKS